MNAWKLVTGMALSMSLRGEIVVVDGSGRLVAMLFGGQDAAIRTDLVLPSPGWSRTLTLSSAENVHVERGEVSTWQGRIPMDATHKLEFRQTVRERDGRVVVGLDYTALNDLTAEGLFFRINIPWVDFRGGTAGNGTRTIQLPETAPANNNLLYGETAQLDARSASGGMWWAARFNRPFGVNLQDKSSESPKSYTFWVYLQRGNMGAGTRGSVEVELALDGIPDTTTAGLRVEPETPRYVFHGFGGNYCFQIESPVTEYTLENLNSRWARTEMSMVEWEPANDNGTPGEMNWDYYTARDTETSRLRKELLLMRRLQDRGIPYVASIWQLPEWLLADRGVKRPEDTQRRVDPALMDELYESIGSYLLYARDRYGVEPDLFSFNEPELGIRILFTAEQHRALIRGLGAYLESLGLKTRMLVGDVSNPRGTHSYVLPTLGDAEAMRYAGALSFHSWGGGTPEQYEAWGRLAEQAGLPLLVAEMGTDPSAWQGRTYDSYWYGMDELRMYQELLQYARPQALVYWEFTADYSLVRLEGEQIVPTGRFWLMKQLTELTPAMAESLAVASDHGKVLVSAFRKDGGYAIHVANLSAERDVALTGLPKEIVEWRAVVTSETEGFAEQAPVTAEDGGMRLRLPARSLLTLVGRTN